MVWNDAKITTWAQSGGVTPFDASCVNPASLDLRLGNLIHRPHYIWDNLSQFDMAMRISEQTIDELPRWSDPVEFGAYWLMPGKFVLCHSLELVQIPVNAACILVLKSSKGRLGLNHSHSGWGDPGFGLVKRPNPLVESLNTMSDAMSIRKRASPVIQDGAQWTFELSNIAPWPIKLTEGERLIQQVFFDMADAPNIDYRYTGHYTYQRGPTEAV